LYLIETVAPVSDSTLFTEQLDQELYRLNEDYQAHRRGGTCIASPRILWLKPGSFAEWMKSQGKFGGQHKVPRMDNTGAITRVMADWFQSNNLIIENQPA
jgi:hypothetical protein